MAIGRCRFDSGLFHHPERGLTSFLFLGQQSVKTVPAMM